MSERDNNLDGNKDELFQGEVHHISASKIADQFWCEMQLHLKLQLGLEPTPEMIKGSEIHRSLEEELGPVIEVEVTTNEDSIIAYILQMYSKLVTFNTLQVTRELPVIGKINGVSCLGIIDQIKIETDNEGKKLLIITDYKTRKSRRAPTYEQKRRNRIQMQVYWHLLSDLKSGKFSEEMFKDYFDMPEKLVPSEELLKQLPEEQIKLLEVTPPHELLTKVFEILRNLPEQSFELHAIYLHQEDRSEVCNDRSLYHQESFEVDMDWALGYWKGERKPSDCPQTWMCKFCQFTDNCSYFLREYLKDKKKKEKK
ncbi:MAG: hypothetical protein ACTSQK_06960 [Candidatus Heimdallarchaeota archaeon]